jgi:hypothetical protein
MTLSNARSPKQTREDVLSLHVNNDPKPWQAQVGDPRFAPVWMLLSEGEMNRPGISGDSIT